MSPRSIACLISQGRVNTAPTNTISMRMVPTTRCRTGLINGSSRLNIERSRLCCARASSSSMSDSADCPLIRSAIVLDPHQFTVGCTGPGQIPMGTLGRNVAVSQQQDPVGHQNGRQLAGHYEHSDGVAAGRVPEFADVAQYCPFGCRIESAGRIIETEDGSFGQQRTREAQTLALASGECDSSITELSIQTSGQTLNDIRGRGELQSAKQIHIAGARIGHA